MLTRALAILLALVAFSVAWAEKRSAQPQPIAIDELRPSQVAIGKQNAMQRYGRIVADARANHTSLRDYAAKTLAPKLASSQLPVIIDPKGNYHPLDGHHRVTAWRQVEQDTGVKLSVQTKVIFDYRGWSQHDFAQHFVHKLHEGNFGPELRGASADRKVAALPKSFARLRDDPLRSAVGQAMDNMSSSRTNQPKFENYIEFKVGGYLMRHGLMKRLARDGVVPRGTKALPTDRALDPRVVRTIETMMTSRRASRFLQKHVMRPRANT